jgi:small-conductance mechanosensitive channel
MEFPIQKLQEYILPAGLFASGIVVGFIVEKIFLFRLRRIAIKSRWEGGRVILHATKGITFLWFILAGTYSALHNLPAIGPKLLVNLTLALTVILILSVTILISKLATGFVKLYTGKVLPSTSIFVNLTKVFVFILGMLVMLQTMGISVAPILTALGVGGLAVALALQDTLTNLFAGLHIIASKKVKTGDYIKLESGQEGILEDITWRNTSIKTPQNNTIIVPNSKIASSIITNYNIPSKDIVAVIPLTVNYESNLDDVERVTKEVAREVMSQMEYVKGFDIEPVIRYTSFGESSINFEIVVKAKELGDKGLISHNLIKKLHIRYQQEGFKTPFPTRTLHIQNIENQKPTSFLN